MTNPPADAMREASNIVEAHIFACGYIPHPDFMKDAIARAISAARTDQDGWRPIETAPKDGTRLLFCYASPKMNADALPVLSGHWSRLSDCWFSTITDDKINPTHWQPLPSAPVKQEGK